MALGSIHITDDELDALILSYANEKWQKVALIIGKVMGASNVLQPERIAARLAALVSAGILENVGDINKWRFSEIRLPARST